MGDLQELLFAVIGIVVGGGGIGAILQARESRRRGVTEAHVASQQLALTTLDTTVKALQSEVERLREDREEDRRALDELGRSNRLMDAERQATRAAVRDIAGALAEYIAWLEAGTGPPAPHSLTFLLDRLHQLLPEEKP